MTEPELLAAIAANPDDDVPRLAYADLLDGRDSDRAALIRLQCEQARNGNTTDLQERIGRLLDTHHRRWEAEAGIVGPSAIFQRGFPRALIGNCEALLTSREALRTQPIIDVSITGKYERLPDVVAMPELARVSVLSFAAVQGDYRGKPLARAHVEALAGSRCLAGLRELAFNPEALDAGGAAALANAAWLPTIERLAVGNTRLGAGAAALLERLVAVRGLWLSGSEVRDDGLLALARSGVRRLEHLALRSSDVDSAGVIALLSSPVMASIERLDLARNYFGDESIVALAGSPHVAALRELALSENGLTVVAAKALAGSTTLGSLEVLTLHDNRIGHAGVDALASSRGLPKLRSLGLSKNEIVTGARRDFEAGSEAAGDYYAGSSAVEQTAHQLAARFTHRPGLIVS